LEKQSKESKEVRRLSSGSEKNLMKIHRFVENFGDVVSKAKMFDEEIHKAGNEAAVKAVTVLAEYLETMEKIMYEVRDVLQKAVHYSDPKKGGKSSPMKESTPTLKTQLMSPPAPVKPKGKKEEKKPAKKIPKH